MSKFTEIFKAKATQIAITSLSACLVIGACAGVIVHNNNKKLEAALNELSNTSITESISESSSETTTESTTESTTENTTVSTTVSTTKATVKKTTTTEPAGDKTIQYLAEYEKITNEYKKKRAELEAKDVGVIVSTKPYLPNASDEERASISEANSEALSIAALQSEEVVKVRKELDELDAQYKKDIEHLKKKYGIIE